MDLIRKLAEFQAAYCNAHRIHRSFAGDTPAQCAGVRPPPLLRRLITTLGGRIVVGCSRPRSPLEHQFATQNCFEQVRVAIKTFQRHTKRHTKVARLSNGTCAPMSRLQELKQYIAHNVGTLVNSHRRHEAGLRVSSRGAESSVNFLINWRMNKCQQMRWSRL